MNKVIGVLHTPGLNWGDIYNGKRVTEAVEGSRGYWHFTFDDGTEGVFSTEDQGSDNWDWYYIPIPEDETDEVSPNHYQFPGGVEVRDISAHLTSFGGQALQYIARSTRLDGQNKGSQVTDLQKAIALLEWEIDRIEDLSS